jgi:hypothetical protein
MKRIIDCVISLQQSFHLLHTILFQCKELQASTNYNNKMDHGIRTKGMHHVIQVFNGLMDSTIQWTLTNQLH